MIDMQTEIIKEIIRLLKVVPDVGLIEEDTIVGIIDSDDESLPARMIVIQEGDSEEVERKGAGSVRETMTLVITPITSARKPGPWLRQTRLAIKAALAGVKGGITIEGMQTLAFQPETPAPAQEASRWSFRLMPVRITYVQQLK